MSHSIAERGVNEASTGVEAEDAAVSAHEEVVEERIENPDPDQLGQSGAIAEQRRYQEEGARGAAAAVNADGGEREKTLEERQFRIEILQVPFSFMWQIKPAKLLDKTRQTLGQNPPN